MLHDVFFFFQAEDGIRYYKVTGVQTCALPIWAAQRAELSMMTGRLVTFSNNWTTGTSRHGNTTDSRNFPRWLSTKPGKLKIGRASCRERVSDAMCRV